MVSNPLQSPINYEPVGAHHCRHSWISKFLTDMFIDCYIKNFYRVWRSRP